MDTLKLFMAISVKVNFLQMGRYSEFSEQIYRNYFVNETVDCFSFNEHIVRKVLTGNFGYRSRFKFLSQVRIEDTLNWSLLAGVVGEMKCG